MPPVVLRAHRLPHRLGAVHGAHEVDVDDETEVGEVHLGEAPVAQDAGVVDEDVDPAPFLERRPDHLLHRVRVGHRRAAGDRLAAGGADLLGDGVRRGRRRAAVAVDHAAEIVDHHRRATRRECERVPATESPPAPVTIATLPSNRIVMLSLVML